MKIDILNELETFIAEENPLKVSKKVNELLKQFNTVKAKEIEALKEQAQIEEDTEDAEEVELTVVELSREEQELNIKVEQKFTEFDNKIKSFLSAKNEQESKNLVAKKEILTELENLIQNEEHIGKAFASVKELQAKWKTIGFVPQKNAIEIQNSYSKLNEAFFYNINIYKELQENDLKKNYSLKNQIVFKLEELKKEENIKSLEKQLAELRNDWDEIGGTYPDKWEEIKESYWTNVKGLYDKIQKHYDSLKEKQKENLEKKVALLEELKNLVKEEVNTHKDWDVATSKIKSIQENWKKAGYTSKDESEKIWNEFRAECDVFFERKSEFYTERNTVFDANRDKKQVLVDKAQKLKDSTSWKDTSNALKRLQSDWKKIGSAGQRNENRLWKDFRSACDHFFNAKNSHFEAQDKLNEGNLAEKLTLISEIEVFKPIGTPKEIVAQLKEFSAKFNEIGNVPFKKKDDVYKGYKAALDKHYDAIKMDQKEKESLLFEAKIETLKQSADSEKALYLEKDKIRKQITTLNSEINQYENNLGFFSNSKGAEDLIADVNKKIAVNKAKIDALKAKLKMVNEA